MKPVVALTESVRLNDRAPHRDRVQHRRAPEPAPIPRERGESIPWLVALIPLGSLLVATLFGLGLARLVAMPTVPARIDPPARIESVVDEAHGIGVPVVEAVEGDGGSLTVGPGYTR